MLNGQPKLLKPPLCQGQFGRLTIYPSTTVRERLSCRYANDLGLDIPQFLKELSKQVHVDRINEDIESGCKSGITAAPVLLSITFDIPDAGEITVDAAIVATSH